MKNQTKPTNQRKAAMNTKLLITLIEALSAETKTEADTLQPEQHPAAGTVCIIRTFSAGVHFGTVESVSHYGHAAEVVLKNSRRVWKWSGAFTLSELAESGFDADDTRISAVLPLNYLQGVCEIIPAGQAFLAQTEKCHE